MATIAKISKQNKRLLALAFAGVAQLAIFTSTSYADLTDQNKVNKSAQEEIEQKAEPESKLKKAAKIALAGGATVAAVYIADRYFNDGKLAFITTAPLRAIKRKYNNLKDEFKDRVVISVTPPQITKRRMITISIDLTGLVDWKAK